MTRVSKERRVMIEKAFFACVDGYVPGQRNSKLTAATETLKMTKPEEMVAPRTRVTLFHGVHPFQSTDTVPVHAATYWLREENREFYTENKSPGPRCRMFDDVCVLRNYSPARRNAPASMTSIFFHRQLCRTREVYLAALFTFLIF